MRRLGKWIGILLAVVVVVTAVITMVFMILHNKSNSCRHKGESRQLPAIYITTERDIPWKGKIPCRVAVVTNTDSTVWNGKVKFRGGVSSKYDKHSYSLKLKEPHSLCGLPENVNWIINASYIDKTLMRHKLCYDLFRQMGQYNLAPECAYALVRENGKPQGLYVVMQRLDERTLGLRKSDPAAVIYKEPRLFYHEEQFPKRESGENFHEQTYPEFEEVDKNSLMDDFRQFILHSSDADFYTHIGEWIDLQNLIDWHLFLQLVNGGDNVKKNFYLYKIDSSTPYRIALWDCDHSFGRDCDGEKNMLERMLEDRQNILLNRMLQSESYRQALKKRYWQLRQTGIFSYENIEEMMRQNDAYVRLGLNENTTLWPYDSENYYDSASYEEEYDLMLEFVKKSFERLDRLMK